MGLLIVGTGALGCLFAGRLASMGLDVTMMGNWTEGLSALRKYGVRILNLEGNSNCYPVKVIDGSTCEGNYLQSLVLVKSWQTKHAAEQLGRCLSENGVALTLQNGLGNKETLEEVLTPERVALGVTTVGARMLEPGYVQFTGNGKIFLGTHPRSAGLGDLLVKAGFQVEMVSDPTSVLWGKLVINAAINPLTAVLRVTNGELLTRPTAREVMVKTTQEAALIATRQAISLPYDDPVWAVEEVARSTAANHSSMLQDVLRGGETEIDAINGSIVRIGEQLGVQTPINRILWCLVKSLSYY
jgi:2-dehydropantoate 2-reductase